MDFRVLGPLEVAEHDRSLALGGLKQRSLLAGLLLNANEVVSTDRLIDHLWGRAPPRSAAKAIQVYVSRLRKTIGNGRLATHAHGYVLRVDRAEFDLARFESLVARARTAAPPSAAATLREALDLWRGPPLSDLAYEPFAQAEIARLEELRIAALEQRIDADLEAGNHVWLVGELEALIAAHPLREHLRAQLMLALYRSARQAEALEVYRSARREFAELLGLEPSDEMKRLEQAILRQDPELELPAARPPQTPAPTSRSPDRALLIVARPLDHVDALVELARPLALSQSSRELIVAGVVSAAELTATAAALAARREQLLTEGISARTAAFSSPSPAADLARLAAQEPVDLLLMGIGPQGLEPETETVLEEAPCDVALLATAGGPPRPGPVVVPFGAVAHDWAALELGAWMARATDVPLWLIGADSDHRQDGRDASRLLADASLIVQRTTGIAAEPQLARPGRGGVLTLADGAGLLVVGLSERWRREGLGRLRSTIVAAPPAPTLVVRRGPRPGGLAPAESRTHFSWSLTGASS
jgi:DNA-binding SARP family transcriptional activator